MTKRIIIVLLAVILTLGLVACKNKDSHILTFVGKDGAEVVETMEVSDERITLPEAPEIEGYQFAGWYLHSANSGVKLDAEYFIRNGAKSDVTAYALYKKVNYNLTFYFDEAEYGTAYKVALRQVSNEEIELPEAPPYAHHTFVGWYLNSKDSGIELTPDYFVNNPATGALSVYAKYERVEYTLTFKDHEGKVLESIKISDKEIKLPDAPAKENENFAGWYLADSTKKIEADYFVKFPATKDMVVQPSYSNAFTFVPTSKDTCTIVGFTGDFKEVDIPETMELTIGDKLNVYKVTTIATGAFVNNDKIESLVIPKTVTSIEIGAFRNCSALKYVAVAEDNTVYTSANGSNCVILKEVTAEENGKTSVVTPETLILGSANSVIPESVVEIADFAFSGNLALESLVIPETVKTIATSAFTGTAITDITAPTWAFSKIDNSKFVNVVVNAGEEILAGTFENAAELVSVTLDGVKKIGANAFANCAKLENLHIPASVTKIEVSAFNGCTGLVSITADENEKYVAIDNCLIEINKTEINGVATDNNVLIKGCDNSVVPANAGITSIYAGAFAGCKKLTKIYIPAGVKSLDADSFKGCEALAEVIIADPDCKLNGDVFSYCTGFKNIEVPAELLEYFVEKASKKLVTVTVNAGTTVPANCFAGCSALTTVTFSKSVTEIGSGAFAGCKKLTTLVLTADSKLTTIGHNAFDGCAAFNDIVVGEIADADEHIASFVIPASVATIGDYAFRGTAIESIALAENCKLTSIGYKVFAECKSLTDVTIPATVHSVDFDAFNGCNKIKNVTIPADFVRSLATANVAAIETLEITVGELDKVIDLYCIREMTGLKKLVIGKDVTKIDNRAFEGCSNLAEIVVAEGNTKYHSEGNCLIETATKTLLLGCVNSEIPADVKVISSYAFAQSNIKEIVIPATVEKVEIYAFSSCRKLATVTIESKNTVFADKAFDGCNAITKAVIPANAIKYIPQVALVEIEITDGEIGEDAFENCLTLSVVTIADDVKVHERAFVGCNITELTVPAKALSAFSKDTLVKLTITSGNVETGALQDCTSLTEITIAEDVNVVAGAFDGCINITAATVPANLLSKIPTAKLTKLTVISGNVDATVLQDCTTLKNVTMAAGVTVADGAFDACINITTASIPAGILSKIPTAKLANLTIVSGEVTANDELNLSALTSLAFGDDVTTIGEGAFAGLAKLNSIDFNKLTTIGAGAFAGCKVLAAVDLSNVTTIGEGAFADCAKLVKVTVSASNIANVPKNITTLVVAGGELTEGAIVDFEQLKTLVIGKDVTSISADSISDDIKYSLKSVSVDSENEFYVYDAKTKCIMTVVAEGEESVVVIDFNAPEA